MMWAGSDAGLLAHAIGWGLFHGIWTSAALSGVALLLVRHLPGLDAELRHAVLLATLVVTAALPLGFAAYMVREYREHVGWVERNTAAGGGEASATFARAPVPSPPSSGPRGPASASSSPSDAVLAHHRQLYSAPYRPRTLRLSGVIMTALAATWALLALGRLRALAVAWLAVRRAVARLEPLRSPRWSGALESLGEHLGIRERVRLATAGGLTVPAVVGVRRPTILVPKALVDELSDEHVEAVLAHELAHLRRRDGAMNVVQRVAEVLSVFPGRRYLTREIETERECATDARVCESRSRASYVAALLAVAEGRGDHAPLRLALAGRSDLLPRVRRLAAGSPQSPSRRRVLLLALMGGVLAWLAADDVVRPLVRATVDVVMEHQLTTL